MKNIIVGTAGHIDHGKTTLIKALTELNTDRLEEEQRRGITIDFGFTYFDPKKETVQGSLMFRDMKNLSITWLRELSEWIWYPGCGSG